VICTGLFVCSGTAQERYKGLFLMGTQGDIDLVAGQDTTMPALCVGKGTPEGECALTAGLDERHSLQYIRLAPGHTVLRQVGDWPVAIL